MIERFNSSEKSQLVLLDFIKRNFDFDFYFTKDNKRIYITKLHYMRKILQESTHVYTLEKDGDYVGVILLWKSFGGDKKRHYVKLNAVNVEAGELLLRQLSWNAKHEIFVKIKKDNKFLNVFKRKGFKFLGGRGAQILLHRKPEILKKEKKDVRHQ